jgi:hypothetical protein
LSEWAITIVASLCTGISVPSAPGARRASASPSQVVLMRGAWVAASQSAKPSSPPTLDHRRAVHSGIWLAGWWREAAGLRDEVGDGRGR